MIRICGEKLQTVVLSYITYAFMCLVHLMKEEIGRPLVGIDQLKVSLPAMSISKMRRFVYRRNVEERLTMRSVQSDRKLKRVNIATLN